MSEKWICGKCAREVAQGVDDGQIPEHHRTCPKRAQTEPTDAQIEVIADSIESFFEEHVHMARRLYPDVWKRDLALVVLAAINTETKEDKP